jgi:hypothetical protein
MAACGALALAAAACSGGSGSARGTSGHGKNIARTSGVTEPPQAARLVLSAGRSSAKYLITAPSPAEYSFDVSVTAPASADVAVNIRTWYGALLSILSSTHDQGVCGRRGSEETCFERFPFLPAQLAGKWTVVASKRSVPPATIRIAVTFAKP